MTVDTIIFNKFCLIVGEKKKKKSFYQIHFINLIIFCFISYNNFNGILFINKTSFCLNYI